MIDLPIVVTLSDGRTLAAHIGDTIGQVLDRAREADKSLPAMAALVDGELEELSYALVADAAVTPIDASQTDGFRIYRRSVVFCMVVAAQELFPEARIMVDHSVTLGGYYCQVLGRGPFTVCELGQIEARMRTIVEDDEPIYKQRMLTEDAIALFAQQGYGDKVRLLAYRKDDHINVYSLRGIRDYFYGYMLPSTGKLSGFGLEAYGEGMILRMADPGYALPIHSHDDYPKLMGVLREHGEWLRILGIEDVGSLNLATSNGDLARAILVTEALQEKRLSDIADEIVARGTVKVVLIAGPSSSGKTTFSKRLAIQAMVNGLKPFAVGLDDYFVDRELTPLDEHGEYDFESIDAIDQAAFVEQLDALMNGQEVTLRHYDFKTGQGGPGRTVQLPEDALIIVEGIHGLNPSLVKGLAPESLFRIYVSALTQLNLDHHNRVSTTDTRLLRRMIRDARYRGYSAQSTIGRWPSVRRGEERNIFPYQERADVMFNSALVYELAVTKRYAEPLLESVPAGTLEWVEARRLLSFLQWFRSCDDELVPPNSILREFIGGSSLREFQF